MTRYIILTLALTLGGKLSAQRKLTFLQAKQLLFERNSESLAQEYKVKSAHLNRATAYELPHTSIETQWGQYSSQHNDLSISISQTLPLPSLFSARRKLLNAELRQANTQRLIAYGELYAELRLRYHEVQYLQHTKEMLSELDTHYKRFLELTKLRYRTGDIAQTELTTAEAKCGNLALQLAENATAIANAKQSLASLIGLDADFELDSDSTYKPLELTTLIDSATVATSPRVRSLQDEVTLIERQSRVAVAEALPELSIGYTNQSISGTYNFDGVERFYGREKRFNSMSFGISFPISLWANVGRQRSLKAQHKASALQAQQAERRAQSEMRSALAKYQQLRANYLYYQSQGLEQARKLVEAASLGYRTGESSYIEYLYALETASDLRGKYLRSIYEVNLSLIQIYLYLSL